MFVIIDLMFICRILVTSLKDLPGLLSHIRLGTQLQQPPSKTSSSFVILQLEEEVEGSSEGENLVNWLEVAVGEIGGHFTNTNLFLDVRLGQFLPLGLHGQPDKIVGANLEKLSGLGLLCFGLDHQERDGEEDGSEAVDGLRELAPRGQLVGGLESGHEVRQLEANSWEASLGSSLLPV